MMIFFDIDDTLLDSESAHKAALTKITDEYSLRVNPDEIFTQWMSLTSHYLNLFFRNRISLIDQQAKRITELFRIAGKKISEEETKPVYLKYHQYFVESCRVFPETIPVLERLKEFRMGIITNGPVADQTKKLADNNLIQYFDPIIISEGIGHFKPQKEIFDIAAAKVNQSLSDCIYIGDSYELDYQGSHSAGMKAIWLDRNKTKCDFQCEKVHSLVELIHHPYFRKEK